MTLNNELIKVSEWLIANKLTLKFTQINLKIHTNITLYINDEKLEEEQFTNSRGSTRCF